MLCACIYVYFHRNLLDEGFRTPPSPPMQMSPYGLLSPSLYFGSPDLHISVLPGSRSPSQLLGLSPEKLETHSPYYNAYTSLVTGSSQPCPPDLHLPVPLNMAVPAPAVADQSDSRSNSDSSSIADHSVTSHDIAISMLDQAINSYEVPLSPGRSSDSGARPLSPSSDPRSRDLLARSVAEALIAKLVQVSG